jgi:hypothetical protein
MKNHPSSNSQPSISSLVSSSLPPGPVPALVPPRGDITDPPLNSAAQVDDTADDLFGPAISAYSRAQALDDGIQVDANIGDFGEISREHFKLPCYMTAGLFAIIEKAVANERYCNDFRGVWHDVCWMGKLAIRSSRDASLAKYSVIIKGAGRRLTHRIRVECGPVDIDDPRPCLTFMLPGES